LKLVGETDWLLNQLPGKSQAKAQVTPHRKPSRIAVTGDSVNYR
jgi:hypothetical protein